MDKQKILELIGTDHNFCGASWAALRASGASWAALRASGASWAALLASGASVAEFKEEIPLVSNLYSKILKSLETNGCKLDQSKWECGSTRCIGGWTEFHGGEAAKNLRVKYGREISYRLIHFKSCGEKVAPPSYNGSTPNEATMAYITAHAKEEKEAKQKSRTNSGAHRLRGKI